jgi:hypothetical protein
LYAEVAAVVAEDHPDLDVASTALAWIGEAEARWRADAATWPALTDHDRLQQALAELAGRQLLVLQGCADHWAARDALTGTPSRGVLWFTPPDVWHALDEGMLELNLWHGTTANAAPGDALLDEVLATLHRHGLGAHFDEGRIEVAVRWRRRPPAA